MPDKENPSAVTDLLRSTFGVSDVTLANVTEQHASAKKNFAAIYLSKLEESQGDQNVKDKTKLGILGMLQTGMIQDEDADVRRLSSR